jgi:uncharacterized protein (TIGR03435 family)
MRSGVLLLLLGASAFAQPTFEVASLKPSPPAGGDLININLGTARHGELTLTNTTLSECIRYAYALPSDDQVAGPDWVKDKLVRFDIIAKAAPDTPVDQLRLMLRTLLDERFLLKLHREPRPIPHYALVVAKAGSKLKTARSDAPPARGYGLARISRNDMSMDTFAMLLSRQMRQAVLNQTALNGTFDIDLEWTPDRPGSDDSGPTVFTAIQEQLGLRLEPRKDALEVLVIDHAEKVPLAN